MLLIMTLFSSFRAAVGNHVSWLCLLVWEFGSEELHAHPASPAAPIPFHPGADLGQLFLAINTNFEAAQRAHN